jgi:hypothetical protein
LQPPPERFHPSGTTSFQIIEEPTIKDRLGNHPVQKINTVHPTVLGAFKTSYQLWPYDHAAMWVSVFGDRKVGRWGQVKPRRAVTGVEDGVCSRDDIVDTSTTIVPAQRIQEKKEREGDKSLTSIEERLKGLKGKQSKEMQKFRKEGAKKQRQLQGTHVNETQSFERKQAQKQKISTKERRKTTFT